MSFDPSIHHRRSIRLEHYDYSRPGYYFGTIVVRGRRCLLGGIRGGKMTRNHLGKVVFGAWESLPGRFPFVRLDESIVMPNHFHGILVIAQEAGCRGEACLRPGGDRKDRPYERPSGTSVNSVGRVVQALKSLTTRYWFRSAGHRTVGPLWQRNYYEHIIRGETSLAAVRDYVRGNPLAWDEDPENPLNPTPEGRRDHATLAFGPVNR